MKSAHILLLAWFLAVFCLPTLFGCGDRVLLGLCEQPVQDKNQSNTALSSRPCKVEAGKYPVECADLRTLDESSSVVGTVTTVERRLHPSVFPATYELGRPISFQDGLNYQYLRGSWGDDRSPLVATILRDKMG